MKAERRVQPRYVVNFPVEIRIEEADRSFTGMALNVSGNAVEVDCEEVALQCLKGQEIYPQPCELAFQLPERESETQLSCQLLRFRRVSQHRYQIVLGLCEPFPLPLTDLA